MHRFAARFPSVIFLAISLFLLLCGGSASGRTITDGAGRKVTIDDEIRHVLCSGPGSLRLLTYLQAQQLAVAVDDMEGKSGLYDARPYALAHPELKELPRFGGMRGQDNPELILALTPRPQVIFKTFPLMGHDPAELQEKTGIPVVVLNYGNLGEKRGQFYQTLRIMAACLGKEARAEELIRFFDGQIAELKSLSAQTEQPQQPRVYIGGVAFKGPHGLQATEPSYPPFQLVRAAHVAADQQGGGELNHAQEAKEKIIAWNPDYLFVDLSTLQMGETAGGLYELRHDPVYRALDAVGNGRVYGLLPYNWYATNYDSLLANAYCIGKLLYPERFNDIDPARRADEIFTFLVGKPVFSAINNAFGKLVFQRIDLPHAP